MSIISEETYKGSIFVERKLPFTGEIVDYEYKAKVEINIRKESKTDKQIERELRKLSFFRDNKRIWLIVNII